jgi:hypothetical protein
MSLIKIDPKIINFNIFKLNERPTNVLGYCKACEYIGWRERHFPNAIKQQLVNIKVNVPVSEDYRTTIFTTLEESPINKKKMDSRFTTQKQTKNIPNTERKQYIK